MIDLCKDCNCHGLPLEAAQVRGNGILLTWLKDIVNHFWWCCKKAETQEEFSVSLIFNVHFVICCSTKKNSELLSTGPNLWRYNGG